MYYRMEVREELDKAWSILQQYINARVEKEISSGSRTVEAEPPSTPGKEDKTKAARKETSREDLEEPPAKKSKHTMAPAGKAITNANKLKSMHCTIQAQAERLQKQIEKQMLPGLGRKDNCCRSWAVLWSSWSKR